MIGYSGDYLNFLRPPTWYDGSKYDGGVTPSITRLTTEGIVGTDLLEVHQSQGDNGL